MKELRVSVTKVTIEYFEVDLNHDGPNKRIPVNDPLVKHAAKEYIRQDPSRYALNQQDVAYIVTNVKEL